MAVSGISELTAIIPELWAPKFYQNLKKNLPMANFFNREYVGEIKNVGDTVNINTFANPTAETITDDKQEFNTEALSVSQTQLTVTRRFSAAYEISDLGKLQSQDFENEIINNMSYAVAKAIETYVESLIDSSASSPDHQIATDTASTFVLADVREMGELLSTQGVPMSERALFLDSSCYWQLLADSSVSSRDYTPGGPVVSGYLGFPVMGFDVMEANNISTQYKSYAAHKSALAFVMQQGVRIQISNQHSSRKYGYIISADVVADGVQLDDARSVTMVTA